MAALSVLYWGINFLKGIDVFNKETVYYAVYDKIEGLTVSNPVQINGYTVGNVRDINLLSDNSGRIVVSIYLTGENFKLPRSIETIKASLTFTLC